MSTKHQPDKRGGGNRTPSGAARRRSDPISAPGVPASDVAPVRLQKALAQAGLGSRRAVESWIAAGEIRVNGKVAELGLKVSPGDAILVRGEPVKVTFASPVTRVLIYHKPAHEICTRSDPEGRPTVFENLPPLHNSRWISIGRLDINTSGLLLFTNDGQLAGELMHPSSGLARCYIVRVLGRVDDAMLDRLGQGVELEDGRAAFDEITLIGGRGANSWYRVVLHEGRNRIVRRLWEAVGCQVSRLSRASFGPIVLPRELRAGDWQEMNSIQVQKLAELGRKSDRGSTPSVGDR
ncbi:MAG: rRNA pseudouridine synthase [Gammaproteobacteria bacterium]|nr:rRNA pseudouridine synthase [Gammaproteobacteria bacterium]